MHENGGFCTLKLKETSRRETAKTPWVEGASVLPLTPVPLWSDTFKTSVEHVKTKTKS